MNYVNQSNLSKTNLQSRNSLNDFSISHQQNESNLILIQFNMFNF